MAAVCTVWRKNWAESGLKLHSAVQCIAVQCSGRRVASRRFAMSDLTGLAIGVEARKRNGSFDAERNVQVRPARAPTRVCAHTCAHMHGHASRTCAVFAHVHGAGVGRTGCLSKAGKG